jgi:hypothetical protein
VPRRRPGAVPSAGPPLGEGPQPGDGCLLARKGEALAQLRRLGLVEYQGERFRAVPPAQAAAALEGAWDRYRAARLPPPARVGVAAGRGAS